MGLGRKTVVGASLVALVWFSGCRRDEVTHLRIPKGSPTAGSGIVPPLARAPGGERPPEGQMPAGGMSGADVPAASKPAAGGLQWTLPERWTQTLTEGMRYATLTAPVEGRLEVSVVVLSGPAGGELANVNRWRGQLGLPGLEEGTLASVRTPMQSKAGPLALYDFTGEGATGSRMIVALLSSPDGSSWFIKMTGDAGPVSATRAEFLHLLGSLHFD